MNQELKNDLIASWNESEELITTFNELSSEEIADCKSAIQKRIENINYWLSKYVTEQDIIQQL